jgi:FlaA1/EpsC-like NDP-sugar epimerase
VRRPPRPPLFARRRRVLVLLQDAALLTLAYAGGYFVRFDLMAFSPAWVHFENTALAMVLTKALVLLVAGTYRGLMAYATIPDLLLIVRNSTFASLAAYALLAFSGYTPSSRGVLVVDWMLTVGLLAASRLVFRAFREDVLGLNRSSRAALKKVLIAGAGQAGVALAKDLLARHREVEIIGFVDDDPEKQGSTLLGLPILGTTRDLGEIPRCRPVDQVIVAIPSAPPRVLNRIAEEAGTVVPDVRIVPPLEALLQGKGTVVAPRPVPEATFLSRGPVDLGAAGLARFLEGKTVLVTGAGGSIGSELARQLARHGATHLRKLILLDCAETPLYDVHRQASARLAKRALPVLASVRDLHRVAALLASEKPDVVLHAAALKHVPMCEVHPLEALATNTWATCRLAELARDHGVQNFTLVSTDKAVAPACVMGATKRAAETYVQSLAPGSATRFAAVRFGNVLGSNGSLLPLFHEQIRKGGPVTVTDPRATRFFMTIPEACGLILQATRTAQGGEIYILEMGEPVRILDLAHSLIRLYGYEPGRDIEVRIIGLRPGEKLHETLVDEHEEAEPVEHAKLMRVRGRSPDPDRCRRLLATLERRLFERNQEQAVQALRALVPTFRPGSRPEPVRALAGVEAVAS